MPSWGGDGQVPSRVPLSPQPGPLKPATWENPLFWLISSQFPGLPPQVCSS